MSDHSRLKYMPPLTRNLWPFYWRIVVRPHLKQSIAIVLLMVGSALFEMMTVALTVPLLDAITNAEQMTQGRLYAVLDAALRGIGLVPTLNGIIFALLALVSALFVLRSIFQMLHQYWTTLMGYQLRREIRLKLFERYLHAQHEEFTKEARGTVLYHVHTPSEGLYPAIMNLGNFVAGLFTCAVMIGLLMYFSWWATLIIGVMAVAGVQGWRRFADRRAEAFGRILYTVRGEQKKYEVDAIDGIKVVRAHGLERRIVHRQRALLNDEARPTVGLVFYKQAPHLINEVVGIGIVLCLGAATFLVPSWGIRFSMLVAFFMAIRRIAASLASVNTASTQLSAYTRALQTIENVLEKLPQERRGGRPVRSVEEVELSDVLFAYASRPTTTVLSGISLTMRKGTATAIVGPTGAGKSTIVNLLLGLYEPRSGSILVNGTPLSHLDLSSWRSQIGYVPQDVFAFNATIRENIALGDDLPQDQIEWATRTAQLHEFIQGLPEGYDTAVGDRGLRLSGGQCQRLAIARAIVRRPTFLIFDEATSALDTLTERAVYETTHTLQQDAVVMVIAHRLSTVRNANQIIVMGQGRVVETGTHETLMSRRDIYAKLYEEASTAEEEGGAAATATPTEAAAPR